MLALHVHSISLKSRENSCASTFICILFTVSQCNQTGKMYWQICIWLPMAPNYCTNTVYSCLEKFENPKIYHYIHISSIECYVVNINVQPEAYWLKQKVVFCNMVVTAKWNLLKVFGSVPLNTIPEIFWNIDRLWGVLKILQTAVNVMYVFLSKFYCLNTHIVPSVMNCLCLCLEHLATFI